MEQVNILVEALPYIKKFHKQKIFWHFWSSVPYNLFSLVMITVRIITKGALVVVKLIK